ncbi:unnamed protein product, partial [Bubo scandiacus]
LLDHIQNSVISVQVKMGQLFDSARRSFHFMVFSSVSSILVSVMKILPPKRAQILTRYTGNFASKLILLSFEEDPYLYSNPLCHEQGHLPLAQVAQSPVQPGLEHCQGGGSHSFSGQPVPPADPSFPLLNLTSITAYKNLLL